MKFDEELTLEGKTTTSPLRNYTCQEKEHFRPSRCETAWFKCSIADECPTYISYIVELTRILAK